MAVIRYLPATMNTAARSYDIGMCMGRLAETTDTTHKVSLGAAGQKQAE